MITLHANFASMFGRNVEGYYGVRFYGQPSFKKRERAKDFLCAMVADQLVINHIHVDEKAARDYVMAYCRPLMRYRRNFVWAPMFQILYGPVIMKMMTPTLIKRVSEAVDILQALRMARDQVKWARKWFGSGVFEHGIRVPWTLTKYGVNWFVAAILAKGKFKGTQKFVNMYKGGMPVPYFDYESHPLFKLLQQWVLKLQDFLENHQTTTFWLDSRISKWNLNELMNPMLFNLELIGKKGLSKSRMKSLIASKYVRMCYFLCMIVFDRVNRLKYEINFNSKLCIRLEIAEDGNVLFNNRILAQDSSGGLKAITHRPSVVRPTGKI